MIGCSHSLVRCSGSHRWGAQTRWPLEDDVVPGVVLQGVLPSHLGSSVPEFVESCWSCYAWHTMCSLFSCFLWMRCLDIFPLQSLHAANIRECKLLSSNGYCSSGLEGGCNPLPFFPFLFQFFHYHPFQDFSLLHYTPFLMPRLFLPPDIYIYLSYGHRVHTGCF